MPEGTLAVSIKGNDSLSPALQKVGAELGRARIALNATGAVASEYTAKLEKLTLQYALGEIDAIKYEKSLDRLERQFQQSAAAVQQFSNNTAAAVGTTNQMVGSQVQATRGATRLVFGINTLSTALVGGRVSAQGMIGALTMLGIGSGPFLIITAGLSVIAGLLLGMENKGEKAAQAVEDAATRAADAIAAIDNEVRLTGIIANLEAKRAGIVSNGPVNAGVEALLAGQPARASAAIPGFQQPGELTREETDRLNAAHRRLEELRRQRRNTRTARERNVHFPTDIDVELGVFDPDAIQRRGDQRAERQRRAREESDQGLFGQMEDRALEALGADPRTGEITIDQFDPLREQLRLIDEEILTTAEHWTMFGNAATSAFDALIDSAVAGGDVVGDFFRAGMRSLGQEAKAKALFELAEGFAALFNPLKGGPAGAATHFRSAALYGAAAVAFGVAGGGGSGGGGGGGGGGGTRTSGGFGGSDLRADRGTTPGSQPVHITEIHINGQTVAQSAQATRREGLMGGLPRTSTSVVVPGAIVTADPMARR